MTTTIADRWEILPVLRLPRGVLFPGTRCCVTLETLAAYGAVREANRSWGDRTLAVLAARPGTAKTEDPSALFSVGTVTEVLSLQRPTCCNRWVADLRATGRLHLTETSRHTPFLIGRIERLREPDEDPDLLLGLLTALKDSAQRLAAAGPESSSSRRALNGVVAACEPDPAVGHAIQLLPELSVEDQQRVLELPCASERMSHVIERLQRRLARGWRPQPRLVH